MLTFFLMSEFCQAMYPVNLETKFKGKTFFLGRFFRGSFFWKKLRNCFMLYSQYSSSKSKMKVMGVIVNTSIFLV